MSTPQPPPTVFFSTMIWDPFPPMPMDGFRFWKRVRIAFQIVFFKMLHLDGAKLTLKNQSFHQGNPT